MTLNGVISLILRFSTEFDSFAPQLRMGGASFFGLGSVRAEKWAQVAKDQSWCKSE